MKSFLLILVTGLLFSCTKPDVPTSYIYSEASYKMSVTLNWVSPQFTVPAGAHLTTFIGMVHSRDTFLWKEEKLATPGLEDVAEIGNIVKMNGEIDGILKKTKASYKFTIPPPSITGSAETTLKLSGLYPNISFASMVAPSPDWFLGISNVSLFQDNRWLDSLTVNGRVYDAGTEEGDVFGYDNPSTVPQQPVKLLTPAMASVLANRNSSIAPIAIIKFKRLN